MSNKPGYTEKKLSVIFKAGGKQTDIDNLDGYRVVLSCRHDQSKTGSKAQTTKRL